MQTLSHEFGHMDYNLPDDFENEDSIMHPRKTKDEILDYSHKVNKPFDRLQEEVSQNKNTTLTDLQRDIETKHSKL
ncbi:MAG: hypothetical protein K0B07_04245 [DPANN group archaeon]|nr:hypothetical protein [DPANN group archaeon]